jgi:hypothetical protein
VATRDSIGAAIVACRNFNDFSRHNRRRSQAQPLEQRLVVSLAVLRVLCLVESSASSWEINYSNERGNRHPRSHCRSRPSVLCLCHLEASYVRHRKGLYPPDCRCRSNNWHFSVVHAFALFLKVSFSEDVLWGGIAGVVLFLASFLQIFQMFRELFAKRVDPTKVEDSTQK